MKIKLLSLFLIISLTTNAQVDSSVCIPFSIAKKIQLDLIEKDSISSMFEFAVGEIATLEAKIYQKDTMISQYSKKFLDMTTQLNNEKALKLSYKGIADDCKTNYDKMAMKYSFYKKKATFGGILLGGVALGLASIILLKL